MTLLDLRMSGASTASFVGSGTEATIDASGASMLKLQDFLLEIAHVEVSGAAGGTINVRDELSPVTVTGVSHLRYIGEPNLTGVDVGELSTFEPPAQ